MNSVSFLRPVALLVCYGVAMLLLVFVNGQPTTDNDFDKDELGKLIDRVEQLTTSNALLSANDEEQRRTIAELKSQLNAVSEEKQTQQKGTSYVRWGRTTCEGNATVIYKRYAAGPHYNQGGSGSNFLCLHETPQWNTYLDGNQKWSGAIYGVEYEMFDSGSLLNNVFSFSNNGGNSLLNNPAPCAVCYATGRSTVLMVPARTQCPDGWTTEYSGYLVLESHVRTQRSNYIRWDEAPEVAVGGTYQDQAVVYPVEVHCGSLPCSVFISGRELTCIVCTK